MLLDPIHWLQFVWAALPWYVNMQLLALAALPLTMRVSSRLHDRGYALAKALGLVLTCYITWVLAHRVMPFQQRTVVVAMLVVATISFIGLSLGWRGIAGFFRRHWGLVLIYELIFLLSFGLMLSVRALSPNITYVIQDSAAEKFTDFAILNGLLTSRWFPPHDPWLSGETINYYYFGHFMWASLIKLGSYRPEVGFNLALASIFAYTCIQSFSLGYNLTRRIGLGFLALFLVAFASNIDGLFQLLGIAGAWIEGPLKSGSHPWYSAFDFWRSSRAIENTINEFPAFSFVLGDLHAHLSSLVIFLAALLLLVQIWRSVSGERSLLQYEVWHLDELFLASLLAGALYAANAWDAITFSALFSAVVFAGRIRRIRDGSRIPLRIAYAIESLLLGAVVVFIGIAVLFRFFGANFEAPFQTTIMRLSKWPYFRIEEFPVRRVAFTNRSGSLEFFTHWIMLLVLPMILAATSFIRRRKPQLPEQRERFLAILIFLIAFASVAFTLSGGWVGTLTLILAIITALVLLTTNMPAVPRLLTALLLVFFVLSCFCEFFYLDDIFDGVIERINTVFKLYYGLWPVMVCATILALRRLLRTAPRFARISIVALLVLGSVYPVLAVMQRVESSRIFRAKAHRKIDASKITRLDGLLYLKDIHANDYAAMMWMRAKLPGNAKILEAVGRQYEYSGRFGTITGRPSFGGWLYHEWGWRGNRWVSERDRRTTTAETIYITSDPAEAHDLLVQNRIDYVIVGDHERSVYGAITEEKFGQMGERVFQQAQERADKHSTEPDAQSLDGMEQQRGTTIYKIDPDAAPGAAPSGTPPVDPPSGNWREFVESLPTTAPLVRDDDTDGTSTMDVESDSTSTTELEISTMLPPAEETPFQP